MSKAVLSFVFSNVTKSRGMQNVHIQFYCQLLTHVHNPSQPLINFFVLFLSLGFCLLHWNPATQRTCTINISKVSDCHNKETDKNRDDSLKAFFLIYSLLVYKNSVISLELCLLSVEVPSFRSTPATPGTPGAPLFGGFRTERTAGHTKKSLLKSCKCFSVEEWALEEGTLPSASCSLPPPPVPLAKKVGDEFIGTLILMFAGTAAAIVNQKTQGAETLIGCAATTGLAVMIVILSTGHISGAHLNPAVTISFAALRHFSWKLVPVCIIAQVMGSLCAAFILKGVLHPVLGGGVTVPSVGYDQAFALEFIISFNLMFVVTEVATDTRAVMTAYRDRQIDSTIRGQHAQDLTREFDIMQVGELAGIAVGAVVMLNILIAGPATGGSMNPVRTLGPAIAVNNYKAIWVYLAASIIGALCGAGTYSTVKLPEEDEEKHGKPSTVTSFRR